MTSKLYKGDVVFVDGVHYPVGDDGHADTTRPLRWTADGYRDAEEGEPLHNETFHATELELPVGGEN
jgi:hypothetical protein